MSLEILINKLKSENTWEQYEGWLWADDIGPVALEPLSKMFTSGDIRLKRAAEEAMDKIIHSTAGGDSQEAKDEVCAHLINFIEDDSHELNVYGLQALSWIGSDKQVQDVAKTLGDPDLQEDSVFALERIPGPAAEVRLISALQEANDAFKPRIIYALGHRRIEEATDLLADYLSHENDEIAIRAFEAIANIGKKPKTLNISAERFEGRHRTMFYDNWLRLADSTVRDGSLDEALDMYATILDMDEEEIGEHFHCAAIVSLGKIGSTKAQNMIKEARSNAVSYIVKDTAAKALNN